MIKTKKYIVEAFVVATVITGLLIAAQLAFTTDPINKVETAAVYVSFACTWLCTRQVRFNYVLAVFSTSLLVYTFWQAGLYGSMILNIYLIPTVIYGFFVWGKDTAPRPVEHVKAKTLPIYIAVTAAVWGGAYLIIDFFDGGMGRLDGWLLVGTILAQFLMDRKKWENWLVWISVNVVSVYVYFEAGLYLLAAQFLLFIVNALIGLYTWNRALKEQNAVATTVTVPTNAQLAGA